MRKLFTFLVAAFLTTSVFAQSPEKMSYQAVIRDASNKLVTDQSIGIQVSILQGSVTGTAVYVERHFPTTNANGLVTIEIGNGTVVSGDFTTIDWANGTYFIKTETDPSGGTSYSITGTSQLLSVPYALHAKTAESIAGGITETDPVFTSSEANNITATDITNLSNLSGTNTGDQDISGIATNQQAIQDTASQIRADIPDVSRFISTETDPVFGSSVASGITEADTTSWNNKLDTETDPSVPSGTQTGQMQYWDGSAWITVAAGNEGQVLTFVGGVPTWTTTISSTDVTNPATGKIWMARNLGASQVAKSSTDEAAYGDLYQWGRTRDWHQRRASSTSSTLATTAVPNEGNAWDGKFILSGSDPYDWLSTSDNNLWQGVSGTNNPCPNGYRLPTAYEWDAERKSWLSNNTAGAFGSPLKLTVGGRRNYSDGSLSNVGSDGFYWSSSLEVAGRAYYLTFNSSNDAYEHGYARAYGLSVRCIKD
jgi:hypothetical protein